MRIARISPAMSEIEKERELERAIDEIIRYDFRNIYTKIYVKKPIDAVYDDPNVGFDELIDRSGYA